MKNHLLPAIFLTLVCAITVTTIASSDWRVASNTFSAIGRPTKLAADAEGFFKDNLSIRQPLRNLYLSLRTLVGQQELNGIYLADNGLIQKFVPTEDSALQKRNTESILAFANRESVPTAAVLLPTASAVYQDRLPRFAAGIQFNQYGYIEEVNDAFAGTVAAVDVYPSLFAARDEYLYYRTDNSLTTRGGYLVYKSLANRLGLIPVSEQTFRLQFLSTPYYGSLYHRWGYGGVKGDSITLYHQNFGTPLYTVKHWLRFEEKTYYSLYPSETMLSGNPMDILVGGHSPRVTITNHSLGESFGKLLILGDGNTLSLLPFLTLHYQQVTFADPDLLTDSELAALEPSDFDQVVFLFSLERYMNSSQPARAATAGSAP